MTKQQKKNLIAVVVIAVAAVILFFTPARSVMEQFMDATTTSSDVPASISAGSTVESTPSAADPTAEESSIAASVADPSSEAPSAAPTVEYRFRSKSLLNQHYEKHGKEMGFASAAEYEAAASRVINDPAALHKTEAEDGDGIYYIEATNEFVVLSTDGYIRTYFLPSAGIDYYNRQ